MNLHIKRLLLALCLLPLSGVALAHPGHGAVTGFATGFAHPFTGLDHITAMLAVGMWAGMTVGRRAWIPVAAFMGFMMVGAVFGIYGIPFPGIEAGIASSVLVMGLLLVSLVRLPVVASVALVGGFALFHGNAHGIEIPSAAAPLLYSVGFLLATGALHLGGIALGRWAQTSRAEWALRGTGLMTTAFGAWLLLGA
jgi:urease accessory protein